MYNVMIFGDVHLYSKNYGSHVNYPQESIDIFRMLTELAKKYSATHMIGLGDFTMGNIESLRYRSLIEDELYKQNEITNSNRYELRGNHDFSSSNMTDYEYYRYWRKLIKYADYIDVGNTRIHLVSYGDESKNLEMGDKYNIVCAHNYLRFEDTAMADFYGNSYIKLDDKYDWFGIDCLFCGHIHEEHEFSGLMYSDITKSNCKEVAVYYPGCPTRPGYKKNLDNQGHAVILHIDENTEPKIEIVDFDLKPAEEIFTVSETNMRDVVKIMNQQESINIDDITDSLCKYNNKFGSIIDAIDSIEGFSQQAKDKAKSLYMQVLNS